MQILSARDTTNKKGAMQISRPAGVFARAHALLINANTNYYLRRRVIADSKVRTHQSAIISPFLWQIIILFQLVRRKTGDNFTRSENFKKSTITKNTHAPSTRTGTFIFFFFFFFFLLLL